MNQQQQQQRIVPLDTRFTLPSSFPPQAWNEFPFIPVPNAYMLQQLEVFLEQKGFTSDVISMNGVERMEPEVMYDPKSETVGLWFDKHKLLRGITRIKYVKKPHQQVK